MLFCEQPAVIRGLGKFFTCECSNLEKTIFRKFGYVRIHNRKGFGQCGQRRGSILRW